MTKTISTSISQFVQLGPQANPIPLPGAPAYYLDLETQNPTTNTLVIANGGTIGGENKAGVSLYIPTFLQTYQIYVNSGGVIKGSIVANYGRQAVDNSGTIGGITITGPEPAETQIFNRRNAVIGGGIFLESSNGTGGATVSNNGTIVGGVNSSIAGTSVTNYLYGTIQQSGALAGDNSTFNNSGTLLAAESINGYHTAFINDGGHAGAVGLTGDYTTITNTNNGVIGGGVSVRGNFLVSQVGALTTTNNAVLNSAEIAGGIFVSGGTNNYVRTTGVVLPGYVAGKGLEGIEISGFYNTLVLGGEFGGDVSLSGKFDKLVVLPGAKANPNYFTAINSDATIELGAGPGAPGSLSPLPELSNGFQVDAGADWVIDPGSTLSGTVRTDGTLTNATSSSDNVSISGSGVFINQKMLHGGVVLNGGTLVNNGTITAGGVFGNSGAFSVTNSSTGTIDATSALGFSAQPGASGTFTNAGVLLGVPATEVSGNTTIRDNGIIKGAVIFEGDNNRLVESPTAAITGAIWSESGSGNTLELTSGSSSGQLSNVVTGSMTIVVDGGAQWDAADLAVAAPVLDQGTLTTGGTIAGTVTVAGTGRLSNTGKINGGSGVGVSLVGAGTLRNLAGSTITGTVGVEAPSAKASFYNDGLITNTQSGSQSVLLAHGGAVTNGSKGDIEGGGVSLLGGDSTLTNAGTVGTNVTFGVGDDQLIVDPTGVFADPVDGGAGTNTVELAKGVTAGTLGLSILTDFQTLTVDAGATWTAGGGAFTGSVRDSGTLTHVFGDLAGGVTLAGTNAAFTNALGHVAGVTATAAGSVSNSSPGTISSAGTAVRFSSGAGTLRNSGLVESSSAGGVVLSAGGTIANNAGGTISGTYAIYGLSAPANVLNAGVLTGTGRQSGSGLFGNDVGLFGGGNVTNAATGTISGIGGVFLGGNGADTLVNAGTIAGTSHAVQFGNGLGRLVVDPGAVFKGDVLGNGTFLELASGSSAGTLSGLGSQFTGFGTLAVDGGAAWTLTDTQAKLAGVSVGGSLSISTGRLATGNLTGAGTTSIGASGTLEVAGTLGSTVAFTGVGGQLTLDTPADDTGVLNGFSIGDTVDLAGVGLEGAATLGAGNVLTLSGGKTPVNLRIDPGQSFAGLSFHLASDGNGGTDVTLLAQPPTITGTGVQTTTDEATIKPFTKVIIADPAGPTITETVTVAQSAAANGTLSDPNAARDGSTFSNGMFTIVGTARAVTAVLDGLVFTPTAHQVAPGQTVATAFTITDTNANGGKTVDTATSVVARAVNDAPAIAGTTAAQPTVDYVPIKPFPAASVNDPDVGAQDSLTVRLTSGTGTATDANGTLSGAGLTKTGTGLYSLAATSPASLTAELRALTFTPTQGEVAGGKTVATGFTLTATQAGASTTNSTTTVVTTALNNLNGPAAGHATVNGTTGSDVITAHGAGNTVNGDGGNDFVVLTSGSVNGALGTSFITTGSGNDTITLAGSGNTVNAGGGANSISGGAGGNTFVLPSPGQGFDSISGFSEINGDVLDLRAALAATSWDRQADTLGNYLLVNSSGSVSSLLIAPAGSGVPTPIAGLNSTGNLTLSDLLSHNVLRTS